jgi:hypothetical protein
MQFLQDIMAIYSNIYIYIMIADMQVELVHMMDNDEISVRYSVISNVTTQFFVLMLH